MTNLELEEMFRLQARQKLGFVQGPVRDELMVLEEKYAIHRQVVEEQRQLNNDYHAPEAERDTFGSLLGSIVRGAAVGYAAARILNYDQKDKK